MASVPTVMMWTTPILKAVSDVDSGRINHSGVLSDESLDLQQDRVPQNLLMLNKALLERQGKFDWNHVVMEGGKLRPSEDIGDVRSVLALTTESALEQYNVTVEKAATEIAGDVYPLVNPMELNSRELRTAHQRFLSGARLGYSIAGTGIRKSSGEFIGLIVPRVAICPQALNSNSVCIRKSLAGALANIGVSDEELGEALEDAAWRPEIVIDADPGYDVRKALKQYTITGALLDDLVRWAIKEKAKRPPLGQLAQTIGVKE